MAQAVSTPAAALAPADLILTGGEVYTAAATSYTIAEGQRIKLEHAMRIFTSNAAQLMGDRDRFGAIETGTHADLVVTQKNPFRVPIADVHATKVMLTYINGEKVFDAASPRQLTAH